MTRALSLADLAGETGVDATVLSRLVEIGVIASRAGGEFAPGDVIRVDAVKSFLDAGVSLDKIADAVRHGLFTFEYLDRFHPEPAPPSDTTLGEMARSLGLEWWIVAALYLAMGLPEPSTDHRPTTEEADLLSEFVALWSRGGDDALLRAARLVGEAARGLSEGWTRLYVEKVVPEHTVGPMDDRISLIVETTERATRLAPAMFLWLLQSHLRRSIDRANIEGLEEVMVSHGLSLPMPETSPAAAFVDLSGYTSLTEREGDSHAVQLSDTIRERAQRIARSNGGSLVKLLGDGAMLHFRDAAAAVTGVHDLVNALAGEGLPAHAGVHAGPMIEHDGDYYGATVNLASRIAGQARPGELLVSKEVVDAGLPSGFVLESVGSVALKGVGHPVEIFRLSKPG